MALDRDYLGDRGFGKIDDSTIYLSGGDFSWGDGKVFMNMAENPANSSPLTRVIHSDGTTSPQANFSWDFDNSHSAILSKFVNRQSDYDVAMFDGLEGKRFAVAYLQNATLSGSPNSLITGSAVFLSTSIPTNYTGAGVPLDKDDRLIGYWNTGSTSIAEVSDWNITITHDLIPKFHNNSSSNLPTYFKIGATTVDLSITTYTDISSFYYDTSEHTHNLSVGVGDFTITGVITERTFSYGGIEAPGGYRYNFTSCEFDSITDSILFFA